MCLCPNELIIDGTVADDDDAPAAVCSEFDVADDEGVRVGGKSGLHGECELAEVLVDDVNGTPVDGYKS